MDGSGISRNEASIAIICVLVLIYQQGIYPMPWLYIVLRSTQVSGIRVASRLANVQSSGLREFGYDMSSCFTRDTSRRTRTGMKSRLAWRCPNEGRVCNCGRERYVPVTATCAFAVVLVENTSTLKRKKKIIPVHGLSLGAALTHPLLLARAARNPIRTKKPTTAIIPVLANVYISIIRTTAVRTHLQLRIFYIFVRSII